MSGMDEIGSMGIIPLCIDQIYREIEQVHNSCISVITV